MEWKSFEINILEIDNPHKGLSELQSKTWELKEKYDKDMRLKIKADFETLWRNCNICYYLEWMKDWALRNRFLRLKLDGLQEKLDLYDCLEISMNSAKYLLAYYLKYGDLPQQLDSYEFTNEEKPPYAFYVTEQLMLNAMYGLHADNFIIYSPDFKRREDGPFEYIYMENGHIEFIRSDHKVLVMKIFKLDKLEIVSYPDLKKITSKIVSKFQRMGVQHLQLQFDCRGPKVMDYNGMRIYNFEDPYLVDEFIVEMEMKTNMQIVSQFDECYADRENDEYEVYDIFMDDPEYSWEYG